MSESVRNICRMTNDDHAWTEGLDDEVSCARCHECPNMLDELIEKDRLARIVDTLRGLDSVSTPEEEKCNAVVSTGDHHRVVGDERALDVRVGVEHPKGAPVARASEAPTCTPGAAVSKTCAWCDQDYDDATGPGPMPESCTEPATHYSCCYALTPCINVCAEHACRCAQRPTEARPKPRCPETGGHSCPYGEADHPQRSDYPSHAAIGAGGGDEQSLAERAYVAHEEWLRQAFPDERPSPAEPWRDLDEREREVWRGTVMLVYQENAAAQLRSETAPTALEQELYGEAQALGRAAMVKETIQFLRDEANAIAQRGGEHGPTGALWFDRAAIVIAKWAAPETGSNANEGSNG